MTEPEIEARSLSLTVVRGVSLAGAGFVLAQALTLAAYLVLARLATPAEFGQFAAGSMLVAVGLMFTESGMMAALIHRRDRIEEAASTAFVATGLAGAAFALAALALSPVVGEIFGDSTVRDVAAATSGLLLLRSLQVVPDALMQRRFSFLRRMVIEPAGVIAFGTAAIIACANDMGVWGLVIGFYAAAVADLLLTWILVRWRPRLALASVGVWRELIAYGRHIIGAVALQRITELLPVLLIGRFVGANPLGQYRYAQRMTSTPLMVVVQGAAYVLFPALARITEDRDRYRAACLRSLRLMCALAFPLGLILIPLGLPAATLLFGEVWRDAGYAAMAMAVFPAAGAVVSFASEALKADGRPDILTRVHVVIALASAAAMLALLPFDLVGVVAGIAIGTVAGAVYSLVRVGGLIEVSAGGLAAQFAPTAAAALIMAALLTPLEFLVVEAADRPTGEGLVLFAAQGIAGIALYAAALRTLAPATAADLWDVAGRALRGSRGEGAPEPEAAVAGK